MEIHSLFLGVPLLLVILLAALIWSRKGPHPATYKMSESWTHPPDPVGRDRRGRRPRPRRSWCIRVQRGRWRKWQVVRSQPSKHAELPHGSVITTSGRISGVTEPGEVSVHYPFPINDLVTLDDALTYGSRAAGARFAVYIGDLGSDTGARAREILAKVPTPERRGADRRLTGSARDRGGVRLRRPWPRSRIGCAAWGGRRGVGFSGRQADRRTGQRGPRDQRRHLAGVAGYGPVRSPLRRRTDARAATARFPRGPRAPGGAVLRAAPDRRETRRRRRCRRR